MKETSKNYERRIKNGDFEKYLHGKGIDVGGGDDCLTLPDNVEGNVILWDVMNGNAQYLHGIDDNSLDFVYSSHCLEHMKNIDTALFNWLRVCKQGGYLYICVPHEIYYEKSTWPSMYNSDHKWSFTPFEKGSTPQNIVIKEWLEKYSDVLEIVRIEENLMNFDFSEDPSVDQTSDSKRNVCAQIDIVIQKKQLEISICKRINNFIQCMFDYFTVMKPIYKEMNKDIGIIMRIFPCIKEIYFRQKKIERLLEQIVKDTRTDNGVD